jgi:hypothetical protein
MNGNVFGRKVLPSLCVPVLGVLAGAAAAACAWAPASTEAACVAQVEIPWEHPRLYAGNECKTTGVKVPFVAWGQVLLQNAVLGNIECVNLLFGYAANETEPGGNSERSKAYGQIDQWSATGFLSPAGTEPLAKCKDQQGLEVWATPERPLHVEPAVALNVNGAATERLVAIGQPHEFTGPAGTYGLGHWRGRHPPLGEGSNGTGNYRERASLPWQGESFATESTAHERFFFLRTGIATTERAAVEAEEAEAGIPTELRTGCYPHPTTEKVALHPGYGEPTEEFTALRADPEGCMQVNIIAPEAGVEETFQGTMEPTIVPGAHNCLTPSRAELHGTEERHGYHLESIFGPGFPTSRIALKVCGFTSLQTLGLRFLPETVSFVEITTPRPLKFAAPEAAGAKKTINLKASGNISAELGTAFVEEGGKKPEETNFRYVPGSGTCGSLPRNLNVGEECTMAVEWVSGAAGQKGSFVVKCGVNQFRQTFETLIAVES